MSHKKQTSQQNGIKNTLPPSDLKRIKQKKQNKSIDAGIYCQIGTTIILIYCEVHTILKAFISL